MASQAPPSPEQPAAAVTTLPKINNSFKKGKYTPKPHHCEFGVKSGTVVGRERAEHHDPYCVWGGGGGDRTVFPSESDSQLCFHIFKLSLQRKVEKGNRSCRKYPGGASLV